MDVTIKNPWAVSMAFLGHSFIHFMQLSHFSVQNSLVSTCFMACTGQFFSHKPHISQAADAIKDLAKKYLPNRL